MMAYPGDSTPVLRPRGVTTKMIVATASGNNTIITAGANEKLWIHYYEYSNGGADLISAGLKIGSGDEFGRNYLKQGGTALKNLIQAEFLVSPGSTLYAVLSAAGTVAVTIHYRSVEVHPNA